MILEIQVFSKIEVIKKISHKLLLLDKNNFLEHSKDS